MEGEVKVYNIQGRPTVKHFYEKLSAAMTVLFCTLAVLGILWSIGLLLGSEIASRIAIKVVGG